MSSQTPPIQPLVPSYQIRILSDEKLAQFKSGALHILEKTGIKCPSERALKIYAEHGAKVDFVSRTGRDHTVKIFTTAGRQVKALRCAG